MAGITEQQRQEEVIRLLEASGRVSVPDLSERFGVSPVTVRKGLEALERQRLLRRVRGGAVAAATPDEGSFEMRLRHSTAEKQAIAREAARLVRDGDAIALDASTTCYYLAREITRRRGLVVVTNGLPAAEALAESDATVIMPGGTLRRSSWALVGDLGDAFAGHGRLTAGFFGLRALSPEHGLLELSPEETGVKKRLVAVCNSVYGLFEAGKAGRFALHPFAAPDRITGLFTGTGLPDEDVAAWKAAGVEVTRVATEES